MSTELLALPNESDYARAVERIDTLFTKEGGPAAAISRYVEAKRASADFSNARYQLYFMHLVYLDGTGEGNVGSDNQRAKAKAAMKGFVLQEMLSDHIHPPATGRYQRIVGLYKGVDLSSIEEYVVAAGGLETPKGELTLAQMIANSTFPHIGEQALLPIQEWALRLVPIEEDREAFTAFLGATIQNSRSYHDKQLSRQSGQNQDLSTSK